MTDELYLPDQGDGSYRNPVLCCDYSDPDVIRVGDTYYMTASSFNYVPGLPILTSAELVNWRLVNYALPNIPEPGYEIPRHACGVWAPAIRWHDGFFYIYYGMPDEGIYMVRAADACGQWDAPKLVRAGKGLIDPCPFWDDDGRAYVIHAYANSRIGFKSRIGIFPMSADGTHAIGEDKFLFDGTANHPTIEGPKVYKRDGWYYIFAPAGGVATGWQTVLRSRRIDGEYEDRIVLRQGNSRVNGPHQGAWVTAADGSDWFIHFQSCGLYGRVTHLQPMAWQADGWPYIGIPDETPVPPDAIAVGEECVQAAPIANAADCGIAVETYRKPKAPECEPSGEIGDDDFSGALGLQWQFMGNWQPDFYEVGGGKLRLYARKLPDGGNRLWQCPQTLTQKIACPAFFATTTLDAAHLQAGEQAGVGFVGGQYAYAAVRRTERGVSLVFVTSDGKEHTESATETVPIQDAPVTFRVTLLPTSSSTAVASFEFAQDGEFHPIGQPFEPARHTWVGARLALFCMPMNGGDDHGGWAEFGAVRVEAIETL